MKWMQPRLLKKSGAQASSWAGWKSVSTWSSASSSAADPLRFDLVFSSSLPSLPPSPCDLLSAKLNWQRVRSFMALRTFCRAYSKYALSTFTMAWCWPCNALLKASSALLLPFLEPPAACGFGMSKGACRSSCSNTSMAFFASFLAAFVFRRATDSRARYMRQKKRYSAREIVSGARPCLGRNAPIVRLGRGPSGASRSVDVPSLVATTARGGLTTSISAAAATASALSPASSLPLSLPSSALSSPSPRSSPTAVRGSIPFTAGRSLRSTVRKALGFSRYASTASACSGSRCSRQSSRSRKQILMARKSSMGSMFSKSSSRISVACECWRSCMQRSAWLYRRTLRSSSSRYASSSSSSRFRRPLSFLSRSRARSWACDSC
mmetsp:Transcript_80629/g.207574  ORF Transcript_80629/g.207574 Transcript_80629/m.207574 type:complete len:380 (-) Transcript_80629:241-1380(-)